MLLTAKITRPNNKTKVFSRMLYVLMFLFAFYSLYYSPNILAKQTVNEIPPGKLSFKAYGSELGLPGVRVMHLIQDTQGFIWVGSDAGLFRYDGHRYTEFGLDAGLPSSEVLGLHIGPKGSLWVGTRLGLARWNGRKLDAITSDKSLPNIAINGITSGSKNLWVGTVDGPFMRTESGRFDKPDGWTNGSVTSLWANKQTNTVWMASWNGKTHVQAFTMNGWKTITIPKEMLKERIDGIAEDSSGRLWARAPRSLWVLEPGSSTFKAVTPPVQLISDRGILIAGNHGDIWFPTQHGLMHLENDNWNMLTLEQGFPTTWCWSVLVDNEGSLWVGSSSVFRLRGHGAWRSHTKTEGLPSDIIWNIVRDRNQQLWVGTDNGLAQATTTGWKTVAETLGRGIRTVVAGDDGILFMAGAPGDRVLRYDPLNKDLEPIKLSSDAVPNRILRILLDQSGALWASTDGAGLFKAETTTQPIKFSRVTLPGGSPTEYMGDVYEDSESRIWVAGESGLAMLENGFWRRFTEKDGLKKDHVEHVISTTNGDLLISYNDPLGVTRARYTKGELTFIQDYNTSNVLESDKIYQIGEDANEQIWIGTSAGADLIKAEKRKHFGIEQGLISEDTDNMAFLAEPNGDVWIGTSGGLAHFEAKAHPIRNELPKSAILSLTFGKDSFLPDDKGVKVAYQSSTFEARFSSLSFLQQNATQQFVRLVGLESEWRPSNTHETRYPALPSGKYRFEVRSQVKFGEPGPTTAFEFEILPPWWQTWWFRGFIILAFAGLIVLIVRWRLLALKRQNSLLEALVAERTNELTESHHALELANEALKNQSLTDPLTGLRNRRFLGECMPEDVAQVNRVNREVIGPRKDRVLNNRDLLFLMIDLDHFKLVNDEHGHAAGDAVLTQLAKILHQETRNTDTLVRWGGEEFLIVGRQVCRQDYTILAERIRSQVAACKFDIGEEKSLRLTCSIGFSIYPFVPEIPSALPWEKVVEIADQCLYVAKRSGRNAWVGICTAEDSDPDITKNTTSGNIVELIQQGSIVVNSSISDIKAIDWS